MTAIGHFFPVPHPITSTLSLIWTVDVFSILCKELRKLGSGQDTSTLFNYIAAPKPLPFRIPGTASISGWYQLTDIWKHIFFFTSENSKRKKYHLKPCLKERCGLASSQALTTGLVCSLGVAAANLRVSWVRETEFGTCKCWLRQIPHIWSAKY